MKQLTIVGNLCADPDLKWGQSGTPWCRVNVAVNTRRRTKSGEWEDGDTTFIVLKVFGKLAEKLADVTSKGDSVIATGDLEVDEWTTKDGETRRDVVLTARQVGLNLRWLEPTVHHQEDAPF